MGGPVLTSQAFTAPADGFIKGLSMNLTYVITGGYLFVSICINAVPTYDFTLATVGNYKGYKIFTDGNRIPIIAGDLIACTVSTSADFTTFGDPDTQLQLDVIMEFASLPPVEVPVQTP